MRCAWSHRHWKPATSIWCSRGFCAERPTITWCWWLCQEWQLLCQESSSLWGKDTHMTVYFHSSLLTSRLNLTHHLAEYFLAWLWVYRHSHFQLAALSPQQEGIAISCQPRTATRVPHNGIQSVALHMLNHSAPTVSYHAHRWQLGSTLPPPPKACLLPL